MSFKRPESVLVVIYDQHKQVLALQRQDDPNFWQSVTGTLEIGELPAETAVREVLEEIGVDIIKHEYQLFDADHTNQYEIRPQWRHRYPPNVTTNTEYVYLLEIASDICIRLTEHLAYRWISPQEALQLMWSESNRDAIKKYLT